MKDISPMLCTLVHEPFDEKGWIFEIKWDGYRILAKKNTTVQLVTRNKKNYTDRFPSIVEEVKKIKGSFIIDGEIVILNKSGKSDFQKLQNYYKNKNGIPYYYVFDIIHLNGKDLYDFPLIERKNILKKLIKGQRHIRFSDHIFEKGKAFFQSAAKKGLEGIIAKRAESTYKFSRSRDWLKIKTKNRQEVVIGGFTAPKGARDQFGALLVGIYDKKKLRYAGRVGTGFNCQDLKDVYEELKKNVTHNCPFMTIPKLRGKMTWVKPKLVCEVEFTEWTNDIKMRHPSFKGLRFDKSPKKVEKE